MRITQVFQLALAAALAGGVMHAGPILYVAQVTGIGSKTIGEYDATTGATINASFITGLGETQAEDARN